MNTTTITTEQIDQLIKSLIEDKVTPDLIGVSKYEDLYTLATERDISAYLVEYLVGYKILKLEENQQLTYKDFDLTEAYEDSYFRMFEDCE
jgi:hypothetical protein